MHLVSLQNFPKNWHSLPSDTRTYVRVSVDKKCQFFGKFCEHANWMVKFRTLLVSKAENVKKNSCCQIMWKKNSCSQIMNIQIDKMLRKPRSMEITWHGFFLKFFMNCHHIILLYKCYQIAQRNSKNEFLICFASENDGTF